MPQKIIGNDGDLCECIIDFEKREMKILDPDKHQEMVDLKINYWCSAKTFLFYFVCIPISIWLLVTNGYYNLIPWFLLVFILLYYVKLLFTPISKKVHYFEQHFFNKYLKKRNFIVIKDIDTKHYILPYHFTNHVFSADLFYDYKKYIKKIHIRKSDLKFKKSSIFCDDKIINNDKEWEVCFEFREIPILGWMNLEWV